jgi:hypothetical protein
MTTKTNTHQLDGFGSDFERRFVEETKRIRKQDQTVLARFEDDVDDEPGVLDGARHKLLSLGAVAAAAVLVGGSGIGKTTLGETGSPKVNIPAMLERAKQNQANNQAHEKQSGEPLISNHQ